jgi:hypothetical protein
VTIDSTPATTAHTHPAFTLLSVCRRYIDQMRGCTADRCC